MLPALGHIGPEVRSFYSVDDNTCLLAGAEQEGLAHIPCSTQGPSPLERCRAVELESAVEL